MSVHGRITIAKAILISQYTYVLTILDIATEDEIQQIQLHINNFITYNEYEITKKKPGYLIIYYMVTPNLEDLT